MAWLRRLAAFGLALALASATLALGNPDPPQARANVVCEIGISPGAAVTGAVGIGNPVGDACNAVTDPVVGAAEGAVLSPIKEAASSIGQSVFNQITSWATDGAVWLLGEVVELTNKTTSPNLLSKGFLGQYRQMTQVAVVLAAAMLIFAVLEGLGRGDGGMLWRVFLVNVPVAALATSAAYVVVQLLVVSTDGFSEAIAHSTAHDTREFFKGAIEGLSKAGGTAAEVAGTTTQGPGAGTATGAAGSVEVPLFVSFIAAIVAAFAAFGVWIELLMRSAAIYAVALFMPLALASSIWPRWTGALRRTGELIVVVVFSKFVIVAIIALAASLLANTEGKVEQVLSAGALLLLACFSPVVLFRLVPFAEGAVSSAFSRQSAAGAGRQAIHTASSVQMMSRSARANWAGASKGGGRAVGGSAGGKGGKPSGAGKGGGGAAGGEAAGASAAGGAAALPVLAGVAARKASKAGAERLSSSGTAQASAEAGGSGAGSGSKGAKSSGSVGSAAGGASEQRSGRPSAAGAPGAEKPGSSSRSPAPQPESEVGGGKASDSKKTVARPSGDSAAPSKSGTSAKAKP